MDERLEGKAAIVTDTGRGGACGEAQALAAEGASVVNDAGVAPDSSGTDTASADTVLVVAAVGGAPARRACCSARAPRGAMTMVIYLTADGTTRERCAAARA
jgi:hypothetical protein